MGTCGRSLPDSRQSIKRASDSRGAGSPTTATPRYCEHDAQRQHDRECRDQDERPHRDLVWTIVGSGGGSGGGGGGGDSGDDNVRVVRSGEVLERVVHGDQIELVCVEAAANPLGPVLVLIMLRVAHRRQERFISPWSADVLRWAGPPTSDA
jgi:hypothetical protein